ncbi:hypothetical protein BDQ12DRAFT_674468 [Crucibulum laeve]|uniref:ER protein Pkr1-domain-containing protein n=1 Tax=Crucibulum laeve TaxID=68775 RepID=A0A5C3MD78_9AGAR|nr:hypothetical protein BDQ12DRAFT_674468 [Crucibulum laeve]
MEPSKDESFFATILEPGSSRNPVFLAILDGAFIFLLLVLLSLAYLTSGNPHIFALIGIELCLWGSVKWFISELQKAQASASMDGDQDKKDE